MLHDDGEHIKEVYAQFGLAVYLAQVLEHGLVNALLLLELIPSRGRVVRTREEWEAEFDSFRDKHFETTLGKMIHNLKSVTEVAPELGSLLREALTRRNWLAHHYFRERAVEFMSDGGREEMLVELQDAHDLFEKAERRLDEIVEPLRRKYGLTEERLKQVENELLAGARSDG